MSTDHHHLGITTDRSIQKMRRTIAKMALDFGKALTFNTVGLGNEDDNFMTLKQMAFAANSAGAKGSFERCDKTAHSISSAMSSLVTCY